MDPIIVGRKVTTKSRAGSRRATVRGEYGHAWIGERVKETRRGPEASGVRLIVASGRSAAADSAPTAEVGRRTLMKA
jgi:hypothetical protein